MPDDSQHARNVYVHSNDGRTLLAGILRKNAAGFSFKYDAAYLLLGHSIDPINLPLTDAPIELGRSPSCALRDMGPDSWGRLAYREAGCKFDTKFEYVLPPNPGRMGNLRFGEDLNVVLPKAVPFEAIPLAVAAFRNLYTGTPLSSEEKSFLGQHWHNAGIGGGRPKFLCLDRDNHLCVCKFRTSRDAWNEPRIEYATLKLAALCGISTAYSTLLQVEGQDVLLSRRFDRQGDVCIGYISAMSLLGLPEDYDVDDERNSYGLLARRIAKYGQTGDAVELFRRIGFNIAVRNLDDHARNHGFLICNGHLALSPAFDIVPVDWIYAEGEPYYSSMRIGPKGHVMDKENLVSAADDFWLPKDVASELFEQVWRTVASSWKEVFRHCGVAGQDMDKVGRIFQIEG